MADPGLLERRPERDEAGAGVERQRVQLRVQADLAPAAAAGLLQQRGQHRLADAAAAERRQHRHPPDPPLRGQARGAQHLAVVADRQHVEAQRVEHVPFQLDGDLLLLHEHHLAHGAQAGVVAGVVGDDDGVRGRRLLHSMASGSSASSA